MSSISDKLGLDSQPRTLRLGESFKSSKSSPFHTIRYDFKPASVDPNKVATLDVGENSQVTVSVPHVEGRGTAQTVYKGSRRPYAKECILIIDHDTGEITLEKLANNIQVKKTRSEGFRGASQALPPTKKSPESERSEGASMSSSQERSEGTSMSSRQERSEGASMSSRQERSEGASMSSRQERSEGTSMSSTQERTSKRSLTAVERSSTSRKKKEHSSLLSMPTIGDLEETETKQVSETPAVGILSSEDSSDSSDSSDVDMDDDFMQENTSMGKSQMGKEIQPSNLPNQILHEDLELSESGSDSDSS